MDIYSARDLTETAILLLIGKKNSVGAALWVVKIAEAAHASSTSMKPVQELFNLPLTKENEAIIKEKLVNFEEVLLEIGKILAAPLDKSDEKDFDKLDWQLPLKLPAPVVTGTIKVELADDEFKSTLRDASGQIQPLQKMLKLEAGVHKYTLVCPADPLEAFGADLSAFEGGYSVAVRGWPDASGRVFVTECAPVINFSGYQATDFAQGRLYDNGIKGNQVVLRINATQQISIVDQALQEELRPFIGTAVILYGKRIVDPITGNVSLTNVYKNYWILCRLTDVKDDKYQLPQAPPPTIQKEVCLFISGTPPWNWEGPNIRTHLLAPAYTIGFVKATERRLVLGNILPALPDEIQNPLPNVERVLKVVAATQRDIDEDARWGTRLGPYTKLYINIKGTAHLTSAFNLVRSIQPA